MIQVGLISDTHGLLRPEAVQALAGSDFIVHAGDICDPRILAELGRIAPVTAVRGNNDVGPWATALPAVDILHAGEIAIRVVHDLADLPRHGPARAAVIVSGHSHRPRVEERDGVLYVNPGSAGPRRFTLPICVGRLRIVGARVTAELDELTPGRR